jgi:hypothetical protein
MPAGRAGSTRAVAKIETQHARRPVWRALAPTRTLLEGSMATMIDAGNLPPLPKLLAMNDRAS